MEILYKNIRVYYEILGNGNNDKSIIFLHGWGGSTESFSLVAEKFAQEYKCVLLDFPPFGKSEEPYEVWTLKDYVNIVLILLRQENLKNINLVAHSFGGRVAIFLLANYNVNIRKLVLTSSAGIKPKFSLVKFFKKFNYKFAKIINCKNLSKYGSTDYKNLSLLMKKTFVNVISCNQKKDLKKIKCPCLLFWGKCDTETPPYMARIMAKKINNSKLYLMPNCGHFVYLEKYYKFVYLLDEFLKGKY